MPCTSYATDTIRSCRGSFLWCCYGKDVVALIKYESFTVDKISTLQTGEFRLFEFYFCLFKVKYAKLSCWHIQKERPQLCYDSKISSHNTAYFSNQTNNALALWMKFCLGKHIHILFSKNIAQLVYLQVTRQKNTHLNIECSEVCLCMCVCWQGKGGFACEKDRKRKQKERDWK